MKGRSSFCRVSSIKKEIIFSAWEKIITIQAARNPQAFSKMMVGVTAHFLNFHNNLQIYEKPTIVPDVGIVQSG